MSSSIVAPPEPIEQATTQSALDPEAQPFRSKFRLYTVLAALFAAVFVSALDLTVVATAAPTISYSLGSASGYTWIRAGYALAATASGPPWVNLSEIWGRKPVLLAAISSFTISSIICGCATSMPMLIAGRALQGAGAGAMLLLVSVIISDMFDLRSRTFYLGLTEIFWALSGAVGPVIGGALSEFASWRWIFYINIPLGFVILVVLAIFLDVHNPRTPLWAGLTAIDWGGSLMLLIVTIMVLLGLDFGGEAFKWTSPQVLSLILVGLASSAFFFVIEAKFARYPVMPLGIFRNLSNAATLAATFFHGMAIIGAEYYLPFFFQSCQGAGPLRAGLLALPFVVIEAIAGASAGLFVHRTGKYMLPIWAAVLLLTLGFGLFIDLGPSTPIANVMVIQIIAATGAGLLLQPLVTAIQANVSQQDTASATSTHSFILYLSEAISLVLGATIFNNSMTARQSTLLASGIPSSIAQLYDGRNAAANVNSLNTLNNSKQVHIIRAAYAWSLRNMWIFYASIAALTVFMALFIQPHELSTEHTETRTGLRRDETDANDMALSTTATS